MKNTLLATVAVLLFAAAGVLTIALNVAPDHNTPNPGRPAAHVIQRGEYLVKIMGCNDCHTPWKMGPNGPEPDMTRFLSGHPETVGPLPNTRPSAPWEYSGTSTNTAYTGPWGVSYAFNLTPDQNTGLGIWTEDMFVRAIRTGKHMGTSRTIMPPMPWPAYRNASDDDLKAVYAYLRTITPIVNRVPDYQPPVD